LNNQPAIENDHNLSSHNKRVESIKAYVSQNLTTDLHAAAVAQKFKLSIYSFHHLFKKYQGMPYGRYVEELRMQKAFELIQEEGMRIKEIMYATGYTHRSTFNAAFKKRYRHPPNYFRK
jgi:AraC-like DNA-binding protein